MHAKCALPTRFPSMLQRPMKRSRRLSSRAGCGRTKVSDMIVAPLLGTWLSGLRAGDEPDGERKQRAGGDAFETPLNAWAPERTADSFDDHDQCAEPDEVDQRENPGQDKCGGERRGAARQELGQEGEEEQSDLRVESVREEALREGVPRPRASPTVRGLGGCPVGQHPEREEDEVDGADELERGECGRGGREQRRDAERRGG